jgi:hypothetical protein
VYGRTAGDINLVSIPAVLYTQLKVKSTWARPLDKFWPRLALPTANLEADLSCLFFYKQLALAALKLRTVLEQLFPGIVLGAGPKHAGLVAPPGGAIRSIPAGPICNGDFSAC